jgi:RIO kinase 1
MHDPLAPLLVDGIIEEVVGRLKSGKEADLWLVRHGGEIVAAKVYKARQARSFRNNAAYKEGRQVRDTRMQRAMDRGTRFGQAAAEEAWKSKEADALYALHAAGVRVPKPVLFYQGVLLMEVVVDAHGHPAPRLVDAHVARGEAAGLYAVLREQSVRMLAADLIHGDLSPYNVLVGWNGPVVIDFPQVIGAAHNSQAARFFERDLENLRRFLAGLDPSLDAASGDAREIWRAYERRELRPDFVPSGRPPEAPRHAPPRPASPRAGAQRQPQRVPHAQAQRPQQPPRTHTQQPQRTHTQQPSHTHVQQPQHRHGQGNRRREAPAPEVIRVNRAHPQPAAGPVDAPRSAAHAAAHPAAPAQHRRHRRRRHR